MMIQSKNIIKVYPNYNLNIIIVPSQTMEADQKKSRLKKLLHRFDEYPITLGNNQQFDEMESFIITYFGMCYVEGYRIIQKIQQNVFLLCRMHCQGAGRCFMMEDGESKINGYYRIVNIQYNFQMNENQQLRTDLYTKISDIIKFFSSDSSIQKYNDIQVHLLSAFNFQYSIIDGQILTRFLIAPCKNFYYRGYGIHQNRQKYGRRWLLDDRLQGIKLHELFELYLKGQSIFYNKWYLNHRILYQSTFNYNLHKIINTMCLIVGMEMIEGGYVTVSVEKWMRRYSKRSFKKFDLLLRNDKKVCIIDWKFSHERADERIKRSQFQIKNKQYLQLARKQYNAEVQLKFYCFHQQDTNHHHKFTTAIYNYSIENIQINDDEGYFINGNNEIEIDSDSVEFYEECNQRRSKSNEVIRKPSNKIQKIDKQASLYDEFSKISFDNECDNSSSSSQSISSQHHDSQFRQSTNQQYLERAHKLQNDGNRYQSISINIHDDIRQTVLDRQIVNQDDSDDCEQIQEIVISGSEADDESNTKQNKNEVRGSGKIQQEGKEKKTRKKKKKKKKNKNKNKNNLCEDSNRYPVENNKSTLIKIKKLQKKKEMETRNKGNSPLFEVIDASSEADSSIEQIIQEQSIINKNTKKRQNCDKEQSKQYLIEFGKEKQKFDSTQMLELIFRQKMIKKKQEQNRNQNNVQIKKKINQQEGNREIQQKKMELSKQKQIIEID